MQNEKQIPSDRESLNREHEPIRKRELFTDSEASKYLRISTVTLWRERKKGKIAFRRVASKLIYTKDDLDSYLERNKCDAFGAMK